MDESEEDGVEEGITLIPLEVPIRDPTVSNGLPAPRDKFHAVYVVFVLVAVGMLFPWNSFILAIDYFRFLYPTQHVENVIPYTDLVVTLLAVVFMVATVNLLPLQGRIGFGYLVFSLVLLFIPLLDIGIHDCTVSTDTGFGLTVVTVVLIALGGGVQQSSYYGLAGMLPSRYTHALMLGESMAGVIVSILRIITKASTKSQREGAVAFFTISLIYIILCLGCQVFLYKSKYVRYHTEQAKTSSWSKSSEDSEKDNQQLLPMTEDITSSSSHGLQKRILRLKDSLVLRYQVIKSIQKIALSTFLTLFVTLLLFPGITSDIQSCDIQDWPPVILATVFNLFDGLSRLLAILPYRWNPNILILVSCSRFILVPLFVLCVSPSPSSPTISHPLWVGLALTAVLGLSNGYFATVCMIQGPASVSPNLRELAGNMMVFFLLSGLTAGAILATSLTPLTELSTGIQCSNISAEFLCSLNSSMS